MRIKKAVFPVAGFGTRLLPATKVVPKEMVPLINVPIIQHVVEEAKKAGIEEFLFITGRGKDLIEDHFDHNCELEDQLLKNNKNIFYEQVRSSLPKEGTAFFIRQQKAKGLGHAIYTAKNFINNEPFAVILPDEIFLEDENSSCLKDMIDIFEQNKGEAVVIATKEVDRNTVSSYGIFDVVAKDGNVLSAKTIIEKPSINEAPSNYANIGRYLLPPEIMDILAVATPTKDNEIQLTDAIAKLLDNKKLLAYIFNGRRHDCGNPMGLLEAWIDKALHTPEFENKARDILKKYINK
ncbi:UTP--glucose-1-phosphate uridylyltransferase [Rickettsiales bacterium LUAb2]